MRPHLLPGARWLSLSLSLLLPLLAACGATVPAVQALPAAVAAAPVHGAPGLAQYPAYNTHPLPADMTGMASDAPALQARIQLGYNIGNTLEAIGGETNWGNPRITPQFIRLVRQHGFTAIRLPVAWDQYADQATGKISEAWLARVRQVVQDCVDNGLYVIVNIHWDGGWLDKNINAGAQAAVMAKQRAYWEQIATALRDFDEHLLLASANEPPAKDAGQMALLLSYHQAFVDAVRATGGRNAYRTLVVQGPDTDFKLTDALMHAMPADSVPRRMMLEVHNYTPYQFTLMETGQDWGQPFYYWGAGHHSPTDVKHNPGGNEEAELGALYAKMKARFADQGIPIVLGEFGVIKRGNLSGADLQRHLDARAYYLNFTVRQAIASGMIPFYWDNGVTGENGFALFDRHANTVSDQQALDALLRGACGAGLLSACGAR